MSTLTPVKPRPPDGDINLGDSQPKHWCVGMSHQGKVCLRLLYEVLSQVFDFDDLDLLLIIPALRAQGRFLQVTNSLSWDMAETLSYKANDMIKEEQSGCHCGSSVLFEARPVTND